MMAIPVGVQTPFSEDSEGPIHSRSIPLWTKRVFPILRKIVKSGYFKVETSGLEKIPQDAPCVFVANHSGWAPLDGFLCCLIWYERFGPETIPYAAVIDLAFKIPGIRAVCKSLGFIPASSLSKLEPSLSKVKTFAVFPEGSSGNCKPFWKAYQMERWRSGFVRLALMRGAKIVPVSIIGGEECVPNIWKLRLFEKVLRTPLPVPLFLFPLPTQWKIIVHSPIDLSDYGSELANDIHFCREMASKIGQIVQSSLDLETQNRPLKRVLKRVGEGKNQWLRKALRKDPKPARKRKLNAAQLDPMAS